MRRDVMTTYLDAVGVTLLGAFAFGIWPPLLLLVVAVAALLASWQMSRPKRSA